MSSEFSYSVEFGLRLSKRIYHGKDTKSTTPPVLTPAMSKSAVKMYLPTGPMVYAVITEPEIVENPEVPSYQPYVHGKCDPPALIPLEMHGIYMEVETYLDTAFVTVSGMWRVHCAAASKRCDCRIVVPMGEQGSVLGVEVDVARVSYHTQLVTLEDLKNTEKLNIAEDRSFLKSNIYTLKVPQVEGGSNLKVKISWSQKLLYHDGQFCLSVPFTFPAYVVPARKNIVKKEKIELNVNPGSGTEVLCKFSSHPLKEVRRDVGELGFLYEANVQSWSSADFGFSYAVSSSDIIGGLLLQSPSVNDLDQREKFYLYLYPGNNQKRKVFIKEVVFVVDISGSMGGGPLESVKNALLAAISKLNEHDSFNIIAFNADTRLFSSSLEPATEEAIANATQWINMNFIAEGGTNILLPLNQAVEMLAETSNSIPLIFLVTDGSVQDERHICNVMKGQLLNRGSLHPRIYTFGIGSYCNPYFLQMLAQLGKGQYDASYDADTIEIRMQRLFDAASSVILANITLDALENLDTLELYPCQIPDLQYENPVTIFGQYHGKFPDSVKISGRLLADMSNLTVELKVLKAKDIPLNKVFARRQISFLTVDAWWSQNEQLEEKVAKLSMKTGFPSEYTRMILLKGFKEKQASESILIVNGYNKSEFSKMANLNSQKIISNLGIGFGDLVATANNLQPGVEKKSLDSTDILMKAASNCCSTLLNRCCCMCFIQFLSKTNDQCTIVFTQLCAALACFECINCCFELCDSCS